VATVFVRQGHDAVDPQVLAAYPPIDVAIERMDHQLNVEVQTLLGACTAGH
jgi:hypothetical protein